MTDKLLITLLALLAALSVCAAFMSFSAYEVFDEPQAEECEPAAEITDSPAAAAEPAVKYRSVATPRDIYSPIFTTAAETEPEETSAETTAELTTEETTSEEIVSVDTESEVSDEPETEPVIEETTAETAPETEATTTEAATEATTEPLAESTYCWEITEVLRLINENRAASGIAPLALNDTLCTCADVRAYEASVTTTHTRPDGRRWLSVYADYGYKAREYGECIAYGQSSPASCVRAWMNDYAHMVILMDPDYTEIGIGIYWLGYGYDWVADFAG